MRDLNFHPQDSITPANFIYFFYCSFPFNVGTKIWKYDWMQMLQEFVRFRRFSSTMFCIHGLSSGFRNWFVLTWLFRSGIWLVWRHGRHSKQGRYLLKVSHFQLRFRCAKSACFTMIIHCTVLRKLDVFSKLSKLYSPLTPVYLTKYLLVENFSKTSLFLLCILFLKV